MFVLIRSYSAGVHCGELLSKRDSGGRMIVELKDARRIWRWGGANTLNEIALKGCDFEYSRISEPSFKVEITDVLEIHEVAEVARENLIQSRWGR